ncbi:MAG: Fic family protein [Candidatus Dormibacteraceae bacterium]
MKSKLTRITKKKNQLDQHQPLPPELTHNLDEWFRVELTYASNALEGNTLSRQETAMVVEKGITVGGKTLQEHLEATNHAKAFDYISELAASPHQPISEDNLLQIHRLILQGIDDRNAGRYRNVAVRIAGAAVVLPNYLKVPDLMTEFIIWLQQANHSHSVDIAAEAHYRLVSIHPFVDGNGRTARLLMNLLLLQAGYPIAVIRPEDRQEYINALEHGQTTGDAAAYTDVIYDAVERSLDIYLDAAN